MSGWWWRWPVAFIWVFLAFLPPTPTDSAGSFGLANHPVVLAAINALLVVGSVKVMLQGCLRHDLG